MKKGFYAILTALAVLALVMTGCSNSTTPGGGGGSSDTNVTLGSISIGTAEQGEQNVAAGSAYSDEGPDEIDLGEVNILWAAKTTAEDDGLVVTLNKGASFNGTMKIVKIAKGETITEADFGGADAILYTDSNKPTIKFVDEDVLYVQMTAPSGAVRYYGFTVLIGWDAKLSNITFTTKGATPATINVTLLGDPQDSLDAFPVDALGKMQFAVEDKEFTVKAIPADAGVTVIKISRDATTVNGSNNSDLTFEDGDDEYLYVAVTPPNGKAEGIKYYKIQIFVFRTLHIPYGTVEVKLDNGNIYIDSGWANATDWQSISRINTVETQAITDVNRKKQSFGRAKLLWDVEGVYIWAQVWEENVSTEDLQHNTSSVELFINEKGTRTGTVAANVNQNGGQYRLGANGTKTGPQSNQTEAFSALDKAVWKKYTTVPSTGDNKFETTRETEVTSGYEVIFQAPWLFLDKDTLVDDKHITLEIQINAMGANQRRNGVLNWNSGTVNSYNSVEAFGDGYLDLPGGTTLGAMGAKITTQPEDQRIPQNGTIGPLYVEGETQDGGTIGYQWYEQKAGGDIEITGETNATFTPGVAYVTSAVTKYYFYAKISNTVDSSTSWRKTTVATINIYDPSNVAPEIEFIKADMDVTFGGGSFADGKWTGTTPESYGNLLKLTLTRDLADYERLEIRYSITGGNPVVSTTSNDIFIEVYKSSNAHIDHPSGWQGTQYNADGILSTAGSFAGTYYDLSAYATADEGGKIEVKFKPGVTVSVPKLDEDGNPVLDEDGEQEMEDQPVNTEKPIVITSVKLIPKL